MKQNYFGAVAELPVANECADPRCHRSKCVIAGGPSVTSVGPSAGSDNTFNVQCVMVCFVR